MKKLMAAGLLALALAASLLAQAAAAPAAATSGSAAFDEKVAVAQAEGATAFKYFAAALAVGFACIGAGMAVGKVGAAAMGAMAEDPSLSGKALPYLGLAEGICLWGFLVALLILLV